MKSELKKLISSRIIVACVAALLLSLAVLSVVKAKNTGYMGDGTGFTEYSAYSEDSYQEISAKYSEYIQKIMSANNDMTKINDIAKEYDSVLDVKNIYEQIHNRIKNMHIQTTYDNWETDLKYSYSENEEYIVADYSQWETFINCQWYGIASTAIVIILCISITLSDNGTGNRKLIYTTYTGKNRILRNKLKLILISIVTSAVLCFLIQLIIFWSFGLDVKLASASLFHIDEFLMAPSYMTLGYYVLYSLAGILILNMFIGMTIVLFSSIVKKFIYASVVTGLLLIIAYIVKDITWLTPANLYQPVYYFKNIREICIGNIAVNKYLFLIAVSTGYTVLCATLSNIINRISKEEE